MKESRTILEERGVLQRLVDYFSVLCGNAEPVIPAPREVLGSDPSTPSTSDSSYRPKKNQKRNLENNMDDDDDRKLPAKTPKKKEKDSPGNQDTYKKVAPPKKQAAMFPSKRQVSASTPNSKKPLSEEAVIPKGYDCQLPSGKGLADVGDHRGKASMGKKGNVHNRDLPVFLSYDRNQKFWM